MGGSGDDLRMCVRSEGSRRRGDRAGALIGGIRMRPSYRYPRWGQYHLSLCTSYLQILRTKIEDTIGNPSHICVQNVSQESMQNITSTGTKTTNKEPRR